jgi:hypothetical protein
VSTSKGGRIWDDADSGTLLLSEMRSAGDGKFDVVWDSSWEGMGTGSGCCC